MSHGKERTEKTCLNCGTQLQGKFCHVCGQENIEPKENFGHLVNHFFQDITHFDGKFFSSLKLLLLKPGFLSAEYLRGKRVNYLNPIRMYVFTAFIFFLVLFSLNSSDRAIAVGTKYDMLIQKRNSLQKQLDIEKDSAIATNIRQQLSVLNDTITLSKNKISVDDDSDFALVKIGTSDLPSTIEKYDSTQLAITKERRDGWFTQQLNRRIILLSQKYRNNNAEMVKELGEHFTHSIPKMMFVFLPLVALVLQLLYLRRRKEFYYVSHGIFVIHVYIAAYILMMAAFLFSWLHDVSHWKIFGLLQGISILAIFFYLYKAMRNFYHQRRGKTILKFFIFLISVFILFAVLAMILLGISLYQL